MSLYFIIQKTATKKGFRDYSTHHDSSHEQTLTKDWCGRLGTVDRQRIICRAVYTHVVFIRLQLFRRHFQPTRTMECTKIRAARLFSCQKLIALLFSFVFLFRCRWLHRCLNSHNKIGTKRIMTAKIITVRRFQIDVSSICSDQGL